MDWNNDGRVDYQDHGIINNELSNNGGGSSGGGGGGGGSFGDDGGCLTPLLIGLLIFEIIKWIIEIFN